MKRWIRDNVKNMVGWRTKRKLVVFSVDDYGNVRLASRRAREEMVREGLKQSNQFDAYDALETGEDLEMLFDVLTSVKDINGKNAVFTPFAVPCNIDFERIEKEGNARYVGEKLPVTFDKVRALEGRAYDKAWDYWQQGIYDGIFVPQFHGREHLNVKVFEEKLKSKDPELLTALKHRSYSCLSSSGYPTIGIFAAFEVDKFDENKRFDSIIQTGLDAFEDVYGFRAIHFNPPGGREHRMIHDSLSKGGIRYLDAPWIRSEHQGNGQYKRRISFTGKRNDVGQLQIVRNVVFEPAHDRGIDWVSFALKQIDTAFRWHRPAIISSHRVNFCGHIDPKNRKIGLDALRDLLHKVSNIWPDVEFLAANQLGDAISADDLSGAANKDTKSGV